ncbi:hypothetical protein BpHYR1_022191, partial [Brachionus plicatilis]
RIAKILLLLKFFSFNSIKQKKDVNYYKLKEAMASKKRKYSRNSIMIFTQNLRLLFLNCFSLHYRARVVSINLEVDFQECLDQNKTETELKLNENQGSEDEEEYENPESIENNKRFPLLIENTFIRILLPFGEIS